jgi:aminoglycoside 6-adenylyltransferase
MILQMPEDMQDPPPNEDCGFGYLMQFTDGNRIDLGINPLAKLNEPGKDSLSLLLLDKDGIVGPLPPASERDYLPKPPTAKAFSDCCNEFWWVCPYVAKGLWREEIIYAKHMLDQVAQGATDENVGMAYWRTNPVFKEPRQTWQVFSTVP